MATVEDKDYVCSLDAVSLERAKKELGENPETRLMEVRTLRSRLEKVPGLKPRTDISFLLRFLRVRKFNQEKAFESVKKFYAFKRDNPKLFDDLTPSRVKHMIDTDYLDILHNRDKDNCKVIVLRTGKWDADRYDVFEPIKLYAIALLQLQEDELNQIHGIHLVIDLADVTWKQSLLMTQSSAARLALEMSQSIVPLRLKRVDYVHQPGFFNQVFPIINRLMKEKIARRLFLNNAEYESLHESIGKENLPAEYRGTQDSSFNKEWRSELLSSEKQHEDEKKFFGFTSMALENQKTEKKKEDAGLQGLGGTFKKLET